MTSKAVCERSMSMLARLRCGLRSRRRTHWIVFVA